MKFPNTRQPPSSKGRSGSARGAPAPYPVRPCRPRGRSADLRVRRVAQQGVALALEQVDEHVAAGRLTGRAELDLLGHARHVDRAEERVDVPGVVLPALIASMKAV